MGTRRNQHLAWFLRVGLVVLALLTLPAHAQEPDAAVPPAASSGELVTRVAALTSELAEVDSRLPALGDDVARAQSERDAVTTTYEDAVRSRDAAVDQLARYSVSAYIGGDAVEANLTDAVLRGSSLDLDAEARHALVSTVRSELVENARRSLVGFEEANANLDRAEGGIRDATQRHDELAARRGALQREIEATQIAIVDTLGAERAAADQARAKAADDARARRLDLRPGTHRPLSVHSGVVPPLSVHPSVAAKLNGEIPPTALDAYWRAVMLTNGARPDCGIDWALIAAIGKTETSHGTYGGSTIAPDGSTSPTILGIPLDGSAGIARINDSDGGVLDGDPEFDRAVGPMQFIPSTWRSFASDGNGDGIADPHNVYDAAAAAGTYLCRGAGGSMTVPENASRAVYAYNRSTPYNIEVLTLADHYRRVLDPNLAPPTTPPTVPENPGTLPPVTPGDPTTTTTGPPASTTTTSTPDTTSPAP